MNYRNLLILTIIILSFVQCKRFSGKENDRQLQNENNILLNDSLYYSIPKMLSDRIKVKRLQLLDFDFKEINQEDLSRLINLEELFYGNCSNLIISNNNLKLKEIKFYNCKNLKFDLNFCKLLNLEDVSIISCNLDKIPNGFCNLKNLKNLNVNQNQISKLPKGISNLISIEGFDFSFNDKLVITPEEARLIQRNCRNLKFINIIGSGMTKDQLNVLLKIFNNKLIIDYED
jgi:Leucine-rich repeat (LRR) protein